MPMTQYSYCDIASIPLLCPCSLFSSFTLDFPLTRADEWMQLCTLTHQDPIIQKQTTAGFSVKGFQPTSDVCKKIKWAFMLVSTHFCHISFRISFIYVFLCRRYLLLVLDGDARKDCRSAGWPVGLGGSSKSGSTSGISSIWHSSV